MDDAREELRTALLKLGEMGRGKRYPRVLLEKMLSYTSRGDGKGQRRSRWAAKSG